MLYLRKKANTWVIDDILEPEGPVYSASEGRNIATGWVTSPGWTNNRMIQVSIVSSKVPGAALGEAVEVKGF
jgi:hypothetical protein